MSRIAVQFGAGNIGRGFLAQLFHESGLEVVFVDVQRPMIEALNSRKEYTIHIVGKGAEDVLIDNVRAIDGQNVDAVAAAIANAEIVCTAVGVNALKYTAPAIALGLLERQKTCASPLNILLCENLHNAAEVLRDAVAARIPDDLREACLLNTGFVQTVVGRMVPLPTPEETEADLLAVRVEAYKHLPVDAEAWVGAATDYVGIERVSPFQAYVDRKLFAHNCAHAVLGYLGYARGLEYGYQALHVAEIRETLQAVLAETSEALVRKHGIDRTELAEHIADLLERFNNRDLGDTCRRLARDPLRKLAPGDRVMGAVRCCEAQSVKPAALATALAAGLRYNDASDPSAMEVQRLLSELGLDETLRIVCGIAPGEYFASLVKSALVAGGSS